MDFQVETIYRTKLIFWFDKECPYDEETDFNKNYRITSYVGVLASEHKGTELKSGNFGLGLSSFIQITGNKRADVIACAEDFCR